MPEGAPTVRKAMYAIEHGTMIGEGAYRRVFRTRRSRWVYKVDKARRFYNTLGNNAHEWKSYLKVKDIPLPENVRIPEMHYLNGGIIATEYINGTQPDNLCYRDFHDEETCPGIDMCFAEVVKSVPISDVHYQNVVITKDGTIYIVDLGHGESNVANY